MLRCTNSDGNTPPPTREPPAASKYPYYIPHVGELFECRRKQFRPICRLRSMICRQNARDGPLLQWVRPNYWQTRFLLASSAPRHACRIFDVGPGIADEHISIRHLDRAQRPGVEGRLCRQQAVQMENVSRDRINIFAT
jgi:hypothetical protein